MTGRAPADAGCGVQRLDKWLWFVRVVKSRTSAAALVADGKVRINRERASKPSQTLRVGDVVTVAVHARIRVLKVLGIGARRGPPAEARRLFEDLTPEATGKPGANAGTEPPAVGPPALCDPGDQEPHAIGQQAKARR
jgi:ribosome-associated heat shock protein Hsp15